MSSQLYEWPLIKEGEEKMRERDIYMYAWNVPTKTNRGGGGGGRSRVESWVWRSRCRAGESVNVFSGCIAWTCQRANIPSMPQEYRYTSTRCLYSISLSCGTFKSTGRLPEYFPSNLISPSEVRVSTVRVSSRISRTREEIEMGMNRAFRGLD